MKKKVSTLLLPLVAIMLLLSACDVGGSATATPVPPAATDTPAAPAAAATDTPAAPAAGATDTPAASGGAMKYDGVTVNVLPFTGPQIAEPLQRHAPEFT